MPRPRTVLLIASVTVISVLLAFGRSLFQGFAPIDDGFLILGNLAVRGFTGESLRLSWTTYDPELYIPLTLMSFQANFVLAGLAPMTYHLTNLLLHAANALLVMWVILLLLSFDGNRILGRMRLGALMAGLLFAVHPLHAEAVVWLAGRKDLLSTFFALVSLAAYLRYRQGSGRLYAVSVIAFLLALLSKVSPLLLPFVFIGADILMEKRTVSRSMILDKVPFFFLSFAFGIAALGGKERVLGETGMPETVLMAGKSITFYLTKLLAPVNLSLLYPYRGEISLMKPEFSIPLLLTAALAGLIVFLWRRAPRVSLGLLSFLILLAPSLLHFRKGESVFFAVDRYAYLPSLGIFLILSLGIAAFLEQRTHPPREAFWIPVFLVFAVAILLSFRQTTLWDSPSSLFGNALRLYPASVEARVALAEGLRSEGKEQEAFDLLREGLPYGDDVRLRLGAAYVYAATGDVSKVEEQIRKAKALNPRHPEPYVAEGNLYEQTGRSGEAGPLYRQAIALDPSFVAARVALARILYGQNNLSEAEDHVREALRWNPSSLEAHRLLAEIFRGQGREEEAKKHLWKVRLLVNYIDN